MGRMIRVYGYEVPHSTQHVQYLRHLTQIILPTINGKVLAILPTGKIGNCFNRLETSGYYWSGARSGFDHVVFSGPNSDHTGGSSGYMFTRPETATSDTANIVLPMIDLNTILTPELSFWWHMYGQAINRLNVYARTPSGPEILLGSIVGSQTSSASGNWTKQTYSLNAFQGDTVIIRMEGRKGPAIFSRASPRSSP